MTKTILEKQIETRKKENDLRKIEALKKSVKSAFPSLSNALYVKEPLGCRFVPGHNYHPFSIDHDSFLVCVKCGLVRTFSEIYFEEYNTSRFVNIGYVDPSQNLPKRIAGD